MNIEQTYEKLLDITILRYIFIILAVLIIPFYHLWHLIKGDLTAHTKKL